MKRRHESFEPEESDFSGRAVGCRTIAVKRMDACITAKMSRKNSPSVNEAQPDSINDDTPRRASLITTITFKESSTRHFHRCRQPVRCSLQAIYSVGARKAKSPPISPRSKCSGPGIDCALRLSLYVGVSIRIPKIHDYGPAGARAQHIHVEKYPIRRYCGSPFGPDELGSYKTSLKGTQINITST